MLCGDTATHALANPEPAAAEAGYAQRSVDISADSYAHAIEFRDTQPPDATLSNDSLDDVAIDALPAPTQVRGHSAVISAVAGMTA